MTTAAKDSADPRYANARMRARTDRARFADTPTIRRGAAAEANRRLWDSLGPPNIVPSPEQEEIDLHKWMDPEA